MISNLLVVDDDAEKAASVIDLVKRELGEDEVNTEVATSLNVAAEKIRAHAYDLLVVDLNLPVRDGDAPSGESGLKLLKQVARGTNGLLRPSFVIGLTAYDDLLAKSLSEFQRQGWALVTYSPGSSEWEETVANQCRQMSEVRSRYTDEGIEAVDVLICTALAEPEMAAVVRAIGADNRVGIFDRGGGEISTI